MLHEKWIHKLKAKGVNCMTGILLTAVLSLILYAVLALLTVLLIKGDGRKLIFRDAGIVFIVLLAGAALLNYLVLLPLTFINLFIANIIMAGLGTGILLAIVLAKGTSKKGKPVPENIQRSYGIPVAITIALAVLAIPAIWIISVSALNNTYESIQKKEVDEAKPMDKEETPIAVSPEYARNKIQKAMSNVPNTQFYDLGKLQVQTIGKDIVFVAPVEFTGFWKYFRGKETEGYFRISATNVNAQPEFVESKMRYTNSSYLNHFIDRKIYSKYPNYIQSGEAQIEVDEQGKPWYVQTIYRPIGLSNKPNMKNLYVAIVDPVTGDTKKYKVSEAPAFIDGSVSSELASSENQYFGKYVHGWLNSIFGKRDVKIPNESGTESSVTPIFNEKGSMFYFTDMASPKSNIDSALGYTLVNARTGELTYYNGKKNNGIMDSKGAKEIVNKEFPEKKWRGSMPILYNIDGNPTWVVNVLDPNGLFKKYAYIKADDADFVVFGDNAKETLEAYRLQLAQDPGNVGSTGNADIESREGTVNRVLVTNQKNGQAVQFILKGDKTIYTINAGQEPLALFMQQGDDVRFKANIRENGIGIVEEIVIKGLTD